MAVMLNLSPACANEADAVLQLGESLRAVENRPQPRQ